MDFLLNITIYMITNKLTNKKYIGQTKRSINERWWEHSKPSRMKVSAITSAINRFFNKPNNGAISAACLGKRKSAYGYYWKFKE